MHPALAPGTRAASSTPCLAHPWCGGDTRPLPQAARGLPGPSCSVGKATGPESTPHWRPALPTSPRGPDHSRPHVPPHLLQTGRASAPREPSRVRFPTLLWHGGRPAALPLPLLLIYQLECTVPGSRPRRAAGPVPTSPQHGTGPGSTALCPAPRRARVLPSPKLKDTEQEPRAGSRGGGAVYQGTCAARSPVFAVAGGQLPARSSSSRPDLVLCPPPGDQPAWHSARGVEQPVSKWHGGLGAAGPRPGWRGRTPRGCSPWGPEQAE